MQTITKAALELIAAGLAVYPVNGDKKPLLSRWNAEGAFRTPEQLERFFRENPKAHDALGIGVACGPSRIVVVDVDPKNGGDVTFQNLVYEIGYDHFESCPQVMTPSGGRHNWFWQPDRALATRGNGLGTGIDVIGCRNGVVCPPSRRTDGNCYAWRDGKFPDLSRMPVLPEVLIERIRTERKKTNAIGQRVREFGARLPEMIPMHSRNDVLMRAGYKLRWRDGYSEEELVVALRELNKRCSIPLEDTEVRHMARCIANSPASAVDPSAWLAERIPQLQTKQEFRVATALAMIAEFATGPLTPSAEVIKQKTGGMRCENYYRVRSALEERGMLKVHHRGSEAPIIELVRMPIPSEV